MKKILLLLALFIFSMPTLAFKLSPEGSFVEQKLASRTQSYWDKLLSKFTMSSVHTIGEGVHEEITNRILGCEGDADICGDARYDPRNAYVLAGVRWNDDPPFRFEKGHGNFSGCEAGSTIRLVTFPKCWINIFRNAEKAAKAKKLGDITSAPLLVRSHFGDMQFLHAMAAVDGEQPEETQRKLLMWSEFTWRLALSEFSLSTPVKDMPIEGMAELFKSKGWSIQDLFSLGNPHVRKPEYMAELAFGSMLHMFEDSYAGGHVERANAVSNETCDGTEFPAPGKILEFHSYGLQDSAKHGIDDSRYAFSAHWSDVKPNVIEVGRVLHSYLIRRASWEEVKPYIECTFAIDNTARPSSGGERYINY